MVDVGKVRKFQAEGLADALVDSKCCGFPSSGQAFFRDTGKNAEVLLGLRLRPILSRERGLRASRALAAPGRRSGITCHQCGYSRPTPGRSWDRLVIDPSVEGLDGIGHGFFCDLLSGTVEAGDNAVDGLCNGQKDVFSSPVLSGFFCKGYQDGPCGGTGWSRCCRGCGPLGRGRGVFSGVKLVSRLAGSSRLCLGVAASLSS
ncbi:hypothetical protein CNYM01_14109 [Colletotrichum nymphaeae SA-01]|uniref:Uncharacterized protein n=1 Tax=Colletotrichum nymphaeae SA-01 TaxID=1460502 RepID=A0A135UKI0_9PEZI|nr:hypothetical protein CNYM01_14109 [Colletotrichum nymphaeae SA-01]